MNNKYFTQEELNLAARIAVKATKEKAFEVLSYVLTAHVDAELYDRILDDFKKELTKELNNMEDKEFKDVISTIKEKGRAGIDELRRLKLLGVPYYKLSQESESFDEFVSNLYYYWETK